MSTKGPYQSWLEHYETAIEPIKTKAEASDGSASDAAFEEYDNLYNEHLEDLHQMVRTDSAKLDAADELIVALEGMVKTYDGCVFTCDLENPTVEALHHARAALAKAKGSK